MFRMLKDLVDPHRLVFFELLAWMWSPFLRLQNACDVFPVKLSFERPQRAQAEPPASLILFQNTPFQGPKVSSPRTLHSSNPFGPLKQDRLWAVTRALHSWGKMLFNTAFELDIAPDLRGFNTQLGNKQKRFGKCWERGISSASSHSFKSSNLIRL